MTKIFCGLADICILLGIVNYRFIALALLFLGLEVLHMIVKLVIEEIAS